MTTISERLGIFPSGVKKLFTPGMKKAEKIRIGRVLNSIPLKVREEVSKTLCGTVWMKPDSTQRDLLIKVVATLYIYPEFSTEGAKKELLEQAANIGRGLKKGGDIAKILLAVAGLPPENRALCAPIKNLIDPNMTVEERLSILSALSDIHTESPSRSLEELSQVIENTASIIETRMKSARNSSRINTDDRIEILKAVASLPLPEQQDICFCACNLISCTKNIEEGIKVLNAVLALPPLERQSICESAYPLIKYYSLTAEETILMMKAVQALPSPERTNICSLVAKMALPTSYGWTAWNRYRTNLDEQLLTLSAFAHLPPAERDDIYMCARQLITNETAAKERILILNAVAALFPRDRQAICAQAKDLISLYSIRADLYSIRAEKMVQILKISADIPIQERADIHNCTARLINNTMNVEEIAQILNIMATLSRRERADVCFIAEKLTSLSMDPSDRTLILKVISQLPPQERKDIYTRAMGLFTLRPLYTQENVLILKAVAQFPARERANICAGVAKLISHGGAIPILSAIAALPPAEQADICDGAVRMISDAMGPDERLQMLRAIAALPSAQRKPIYSNVPDLFPFGGEIDVRGRIQILNAMVGFSDSEINDICTNAKSLITARMNTDEKMMLLTAVGKFDSAKRNDICSNALKLTLPAMDVEERILILHTVAALSHVDRNEICNMARDLFNDTMTAMDRLQMLNTLAAFSSSERKEICNCAVQLIKPNMGAEERALILIAVAALNSEDRKNLLHRDCSRLRGYEIVEIVLPMITDAAARDALLAAKAAFLRNLRRREPGITSAEFLRVEREFDRGSSAVAYRNGNIERFCVDLSKTSQNPVEVLSKLSDYLNTHPTFPSIRFWDDKTGINSGLDVGGLTRDFFTKLFQALIRQGDDDTRTLLPMEVLEGLFLPTVDSNSPISEADQSKHYKLIGRIYAHAFNSRGARTVKTGPFFHPLAFQMIHGLSAEQIERIPFNLGTVANIPPDIYKDLLKIYLPNHSRKLFPPDERASNAAIEAFITKGTVTQEMKTVYLEDALTSADVINGIKFDQVILPILMIAKSMKIHGLDWTEMRKTSASQLEENIQGTVTKEMAIAAIQNDMESMTDAKQQLKQFLIQYIGECSQKDLERLCNAASGSRVLHPLKITPTDAGPGFRTCFRSIDLPVFDSYELFQSALTAAVDLAQDGDYNRD